MTLASIHAVKGREWPHVVVHHATAGLLPHRLSEDVEEERRIFHVALTRCRSSASIVPGSPPSPFLLELDAPGVPRPRHRGRWPPRRRTRETGAGRLHRVRGRRDLRSCSPRSGRTSPIRATITKWSN